MLVDKKKQKILYFKQNIFDTVYIKLKLTQYLSMLKPVSSYQLPCYQYISSIQLPVTLLPVFIQYPVTGYLVTSIYPVYSQIGIIFF